METLTLEGPLVSRIRQAAEELALSPESYLAFLFDLHHPPPRPRESLPDEAIEIPAGLRDAPAYCEAVRAVRPKLYRLARRYWSQQGDSAKLRLSDADLDRLFAYIDAEGVPRLKGESPAPPSDEPFAPLYGLLGGESDA
jgi:hypothetical protein